MSLKNDNIKKQLSEFNCDVNDFLNQIQSIYEDIQKRIDFEGINEDNKEDINKFYPMKIWDLKDY